MIVEYVSGGDTVTVPVTVQVNPINEDTTPSFATNPTISLAEDTVVNTLVHSYTGSDDDEDPHDIIMYEILGEF